MLLSSLVVNGIVKMSSNRIDRSVRRNLNAQEVYAFGFVDLKTNSDEDGWPYPDDDDAETTERYHYDRFTRLKRSGRKPESGIKPPS